MIGACDALPAYTPLPLAAAAATASVKCQVTCRRKVLGSFEYHISTQTVLVFMFMLVCFVYDIVPYQESTTTLQLCRTAAAVGNTIYVRSQMTNSRQHAESTTLQPCRTAAAVGNTSYVRVACSSYAAASCFCQSLSFVTPPYHTFLLLCARCGCACPSMRKHRDLEN